MNEQVKDYIVTVKNSKFGLF